MMIKMLEGLIGNRPIFCICKQIWQTIQRHKDTIQCTFKIEQEIKDFTFHDIRHTFAPHFVMKGSDLWTLKGILCHSILEMVMRYAHLHQLTRGNS